MAQQDLQHDIFLSYASEDRERITVLVEAMESLGWSVWWDQRIPTGRDFDEFIDEQLGVSKSVVVVWSQKSIKKRWVKTEAAEGLGRNVLFPVLIDEVEIPLEFRRLQAANLIHWQGDESHGPWTSLVEDLAKILGPPNATPVLEKQGTKRTGPTTVETAQQKKAEKPPSPPPSEKASQVPEGMVLIPKGAFLYGEERVREDIPYDFYMDIYPVTNEQYKEFMLANGYGRQDYWSEEGWAWKVGTHVNRPKYWTDSKLNKADHPVVGVSYYEAEAYASWADKRLPTEQEWEKAARGTDGREYPWGDVFDKSKCNSEESGLDATTPVTKYKEGMSPYGCFDMAGNVWEWCASWYDADKKNGRVLRGGCWFDYPPILRSAFRIRDQPVEASINIGFRLAQDAP